MSVGQQQNDAASRRPTEKWRRLPERVEQRDMVESVPQDPPPSSAEPAGDPDTRWMLRYS
jgi:hypothetical protein